MVPKNVPASFLEMPIAQLVDEYGLSTRNANFLERKFNAIFVSDLLNILDEDALAGRNLGPEGLTQIKVSIKAAAFDHKVKSPLMNDSSEPSQGECLIWSDLLSRSTTSQTVERTVLDIATVTFAKLCDFTNRVQGVSGD